VTNRVVKDPNFPLEHVQITDFKSKAPQFFARAHQSDLLVTRGGETLGYVVSPEHYQFFVELVIAAGEQATTLFLDSVAQRHGGLGRLDSAVERARRGEIASAEQEAAVFGER
jgi:hypothetical protein